MRAFFLLFLGLPLFVACNPSGVEEATGEAVTKDPGSEVATSCAECVEKLIPEYAAAVCAEKAATDEAKKQELKTAADALMKQAQDELAKFTLEEAEVLQPLQARLGEAYNGTNCNQ